MIRDDAGQEPDVSQDDLRALLELLVGSDLEELEVEYQGMHVRVRRDPSRVQLAPPAVSENGYLPLEAEPKETNGFQVVSSPWVGVFYAGVQSGDEVAIGQPVGTVEALRMRHPVESDTLGVVEEVLVQDGHPVEYGQALVRLRTGS